MNSAWLGSRPPLWRENAKKCGRRSPWRARWRQRPAAKFAALGRWRHLNFLIIAMGEADLAALQSAFVALPLFYRLNNQWPHFLRLTRLFINRNKRHVGARRMLSLARQHVFRIDLDSHFERSAERTIDLRFQDDDFAEIDGIAEINVVH